MSKKKCWQCAELINVEALVCPLCRGVQSAPKPLNDAEARNRIIGILAALGLVALLVFSASSRRDSEVILSSSSDVEVDPKSKVPQAYKVEVLAMKRLKEAMRDPDSMETRNMRVPPSGTYLCGEVNGANAFGGKAGFKRFLVGGVSGSPAVIDGDGQMEQSEFNNVWRQLC